MAGGEHLYIKWIKENLASGSTILEFGSGKFSTKQLSDLGYKMISVENAEKYIGTHTSTYIVAPLKYGWYDTDELKDLAHYDLILIDGPGTANGNNIRMGFYKNIELFNTDVPIVIHDVDRGAENELMKKISKHVQRPYTILKTKPPEPGHSGVI